MQNNDLSIERKKQKYIHSTFDSFKNLEDNLFLGHRIGCTQIEIKLILQITPKLANKNTNRKQKQEENKYYNKEFLK